MKIVYLMTSCKKSGPIQVVLNIIKNLSQEEFEVILITMYPEKTDSVLDAFMPFIRAHYFVPTGKLDILLGKDVLLREKLKEINPDIIHSTGVFPDYAVSRIKQYKQMITLHNYMYEDYLAKFGTIKGLILAYLQMRAVKKADKVVACSESLSKIYKEHLNLEFEYIRNGVDVDRYKKATLEEKQDLRLMLNMPVNSYIYIYTGQFIVRKNVGFLLENFAKIFGDVPDVYLILLGDGPELDGLKLKYKGYENIDFRGSVSNVNQYLNASDVYVSTSKSEGMPNGVLEAMATGLPVILSDIEQHKEIFFVDSEVGLLYVQGDANDLCKKLQYMYSEKKLDGEKAYKVAHCEFNADIMSRKYQTCYKNIR